MTGELRQVSKWHPGIQVQIQTLKLEILSLYHQVLVCCMFLHLRQGDDTFHQSELRKLSGNGTIAENYSRQPAYVIQRPGDFPEQ